MASYPKPVEWQFNAKDRDAAGGQFWAVPTRLAALSPVGDRPQVSLRDLWRPPGSGARGGGAASLILPVLATHTWPGAEHLPKGEASDVQWTPWAHLSRRRIAALSGLNKDTVATAFRQLEALGILQTKREAAHQITGGPARILYRLHARLFPTQGEPYAEFPKRLLYGGLRAALPFASCRQLYLV